MESRRLAVIASHILGRRRPTACSDPPPLSAAVCSGEKDCVFCLIIRGESPAFKLYEDDVCLCILDSNPLSNGHSLIIPKSHFPSLGSTPSSVVAAMCSKVPFLSDAIMKATQCDSFNLLVNNGLAAGQVIFHTHLHIIPRKADDRLWTSESFRRQPIKQDQQTAGLVNSIRGKLLSRFNDNHGLVVSPKNL